MQKELPFMVEKLLAVTKAGIRGLVDEVKANKLVAHVGYVRRVTDQLDDIAALDGIEALFLGPGDMLVALGIPGQINDPKINEMRESVARVARKHNKIAATVCNPDTVLGFADMGYNLSSLAADVVVLSEYADKMIEAFDKV